MNIYISTFIDQIWKGIIKKTIKEKYSKLEQLYIRIRVYVHATMQASKTCMCVIYNGLYKHFNIAKCFINFHTIRLDIGGLVGSLTSSGTLCAALEITGCEGLGGAGLRTFEAES